jgi:hypothetical protein
VLTATAAALGKAGNATTADITPVAGAITSALNDATTALSALAASGHIMKRAAADPAAAALVAQLVAGIAGAVKGLGGGAAALPVVAGIDAALFGLLAAVELLLAGLLVTVATLCVPVPRTRTGPS